VCRVPHHTNHKRSTTTYIHISYPKSKRPHKATFETKQQQQQQQPQQTNKNPQNQTITKQNESIVFFHNSSCTEPEGKNTGTGYMHLLANVNLCSQVKPENSVTFLFSHVCHFFSVLKHLESAVECLQ